MATVTGRVEDLTGAGIPGARVSIRNINTNEVRTVASDGNGGFTVPSLAPGDYDATVEKAGFQKLHETGIQLQVDQTARLTLQLQVGSLAESMEVRAEVPLLNTDNPVKGEVIVTQEIAEMPLEDRDFGDLAFLVPGVQRRAKGGSGSRFNVNGARADNTDFMVDGFHDQNVRGGGIQVRPPVGAMQEFKMQTTGYPAEHGRLAGGVMNMVLKTGGNRFHGEAFEYLRNDVFDARNFFSDAKPKLRRNHFGGTFHGPVLIPRLYKGRNRTFFLATWEGYRQVLGQPQLGNVPTGFEQQGDFSQSRDRNGALIPLRDPLASGVCTAEDAGGCFAGNRIPASRFSPVAVKLTPYYPLPNRPGELNNLYVVSNDHDNYQTWLLKLDHRLSNRHNLSFRYLARQNRNTNPFDGSDLGTFPSRVREQHSLIGLNYTHVFSPSFLNEARAGFTRTYNLETSVYAGRNYAEEFGIPGTTTDPRFLGFPRFTIRDLMALGDDEALPVQFTVNNLQWADTVTWVKDRHVLKFGLDILRSQFFQVGASHIRGTYDFLGRWTNQPFADFLLGLPNSTKRQVGATPSYIFTTSYGFFFQDDLRVRSDLTLSLGLRYEISKPPAEKYDRLGNFLPEYGQFILADDRGLPDLPERLEYAGLTGKVALAREYGLPRALVYARCRDVAPRFGFAWRPFRSNRSVVRGGYGIFFGGSRADNLRSDLAVVYPFAFIQTFNRQANNVNSITLSAPFRTAKGTIEGVNNTFGHELRPPAQSLQSWHLTLEQQLGVDAAIEIAYVGSKGSHLARRYNLNQPLRIPELRLANGNFPRPYSGFNDVTYYSFGSNSIYNAGILSVRRRFAGSFFYRASYIYSKSIDDASQIAGSADGGYAGAQDARNLKLERARSDWDNGHVLVVSFSYETPRRLRRLLRGWQLASTTRLYTGQPFTAKTSNVDLNLGEANRPDRVRKGRLEVRTPQPWFDLSAFPVVPIGAYRMGTSGRNILDGPGTLNANLSLSKRFHVQEQGSLQFRSEAYNVINRTNLDLPNGNVNAANGGVITGAAAARVLQFGLRYQF